MKTSITYRQAQIPQLQDKVESAATGLCVVQSIQPDFLSLRNIQNGNYYEGRNSDELVLLSRFRKRYYYMFVGNTLAEFDKKQVRFIVESDHAWTIENRAAGTIIARNKKAPRKLGEQGEGFANPSQDIAGGLSVSFVPVSRKHILNFFETCLNAAEVKEIEILGY